MPPVVALPKLSTPRQDSDYYLTTDFVVFQVEDVLFRVPKFAFVSESDVFSTMFTLPQGDKPNAEGASADNPLKLPGEKSSDFKGLLKCLYPIKPFSSPNPTNPLLNPTREGWIGILKLATKWHFWNARKVALQALQFTKGTSLERITLGKELKISAWVLEGYQDLANVDATPTITHDAAAAIGWETTVKLHQIREEKLRNNSGKSVFAMATPIPGPFASPSKEAASTKFHFMGKVERSVEDVFKEELSQIRSAELQYSEPFESVKGSGLFDMKKAKAGKGSSSSSNTS